jgi:Domain of unknown function (DUF4136)
MVATLALVSAGCATTSVKTDYDPSADFARLRTYSIRPGRLAIDRLASPSDTLVRDRIHDALRQGLAARGLVQAKSGSADMIVTYGAGTEPRVRLVEMVGGGPNPNYAGDDFWQREVERGTLVIDVLDRSGEQLLWRSVAKGENQNFRSSKFIEKAVDKALAKFPAGGKS